MKKLLRRIRQFVQWTLALFFGTTILAVVVLKFLPVYYTPLMFIRLFQQDELKLSHQWVPLSEMSPNMSLAVMASEDARFLEHHGFDFEAIKAAAERNKRHPEKTNWVHPPFRSKRPRTYSSGRAVLGCARALKPISPCSSNSFGQRSASWKSTSTASKWAPVSMA